MFKSISFIMTCFLVFGCGSIQDLKRSEDSLLEIEGANTVAVEAQKSLYAIQSFDDLIKYSASLSEVYFSIGDQALIQQEVTSAGILAAAGTGAGLLLFGAGDTALEVVGLGGGVLLGADQYLDPGAKADVLYEASQQAGCLATRSGAFKPEVNNVAENAGKKEILASALNTIRIRLRKSLRRGTPNFNDQFGAFLAAGQTIGQKEQKLADLAKKLKQKTAEAASIAEEKEEVSAQLKIAQYKAEVQKCLVPDALAALLKLPES